MKPKRPYSTEFTPRTPRRVAITIDRVPPTLKAKFAARCKQLGVSVRQRILTLISKDVEDD